ncbi:uncharacterized protein Boh2 [Eurosta solidaginis]|uniref:uncharacterized protein Boh2 n=1 Tax=Eurosta solidaginis TaxID=178769 RepID=UPI003531698A
MSAVATLSNPAIGDSATGGTGGGGNNVERRCENADCNVIKLVSMVPKRKITQFVTEPTVMEKPMLINGFTTVFQVEGSSAKLSDLKNPNPATSVQPKTIFRIVPNTHAHIVNYVVVDADGDSLRKINEGDPATMRKLLESQKVSADQMLKKLMAGHGPSVPIICSNAPTPVGVNTISTATSPNVRALTNTSSATNTPNAAQLNTSNITARLNSSTPGAITTANVGNSISTSATKSPAIQLPLRMHPNLKITAVASRDTIGQLVETNISTSSVAQIPSQQPLQIAAPVVPTLPLITPVPLANLQSSPVVPPSVAVGVSTPVGGDKNHIDKMQAELAELRRTVAMLAEAMPMNSTAQNAVQQTSTPQHQRTAIASKRQRLN